jgi:hypothetical protein
MEGKMEGGDIQMREDEKTRVTIWMCFDNFESESDVQSHDTGDFLYERKNVFPFYFFGYFLDKRILNKTLSLVNISVADSSSLITPTGGRR